MQTKPTAELNQRSEPSAERRFAAWSGSVPPLIEQWRFPLGGHEATLTITGHSELEPQDIDALLEISLLFKRQVMKRHQERTARTAAPEYEI